MRAAAVLSSLLLLLLPTPSLATIVTVRHDSGDIQYSPAPLPLGSCTKPDFDPQCNNAWWVQQLSNGREVYQTYGESTSLQFKFTGRSVTFIGFTLPSGGQADISVDGNQTQRLKFKTSDGTINNNVTMWTSQGLIQGTHTVKLDYVQTSGSGSDAKWLIGVNSFLVDDGDNSNKEYTAKDNHDKVISLAAGLSGGLALLLVVMACIFYWYKRRGTPPHQPWAARPVHPVYSNGFVDQGYYNAGGPMHPGYMQQYPAYIPGSHVTDPFATPPRAGSNVTLSSANVQQRHYAHHQYSSSSSALMPHGNGSHSHISSNAQPQYPPQPQLRSTPAGSSTSRPRLDTQAPTPAPAPAPAPALHDDGRALEPPARPWPTSPSTETTHSYESWTSSDFGPVPSPFIPSGPPLPASDEKGRRRQRRQHSTRTSRSVPQTPGPPPYESLR